VFMVHCVQFSFILFSSVNIFCKTVFSQCAGADVQTDESPC
jgi:hypothetical protein